MSKCFKGRKNVTKNIDIVAAKTERNRKIYLSLQHVILDSTLLSEHYIMWHHVLLCHISSCTIQYQPARVGKKLQH